MPNGVICFVEARCVVSKVMPPEENELLLSHWRFTVFTYLKYIH